MSEDSGMSDDNADGAKDAEEARAAVTHNLEEDARREAEVRMRANEIKYSLEFWVPK